VDRDIAAEPERARQLFDQIDRMNCRGSVSALDDVVSQPWARRRRDWYDAAAVVEVAEYLQLGFWVIARISLGECPGTDRDEAGNQAKLERLAVPYSALCASGTADDDGRLAWERPIEVGHTMLEGETLVLEYPPSGVPLEIGHTEPETTIFHLRKDGGVARWPYGHDSVTLLLSALSIEPDARDVQLQAPRILHGAAAVEGRVRMVEELLDADD
jgi:hypothetical protein